MRELKERELDGRKIYVCLARSEPFETYPERRGVIRVWDYLQCSALTSNNKGGTYGKDLNAI